MVTRLNNDQGDFQYYPDISGDLVVWGSMIGTGSRLDPTSGDIYLYQISTQAETRITPIPGTSPGRPWTAPMW